MQLEKTIASALLKRQKTISIAESCTGGLLTHRLTNISGSSRFLMAAVVSYSNASKTKLLKVPSALIQKYGAVSLPVAKHMAQGIRKLVDTDFGISITGIAGPAGGSPEKPVGLTFIGISSRSKTVCKQYIFKGSRLRIKEQAVDRALLLLDQLLSK